MPTRRRLARWRSNARRPTSVFRALPDLLIIGTQRGGTSSLYKYLGQHPEVTPSTRKEVEYFSTRHNAGVDWYRAHFPIRLRSGKGFTFEATPDYLFHPLAAERAHDLLPEAKIIVMLRDPTTRAFSQYNHNRRLGHEPLSFIDALMAEPERIRGERERLISDPSYRATSLRRHGYVERGKYDEQLPAWLDLFGSEQVMVIRSEDFFASPESTYAEVITFLGLAPFDPPEFRNFSIRRTSGGETEGKLEPAIRERLDETFRPHASNLERLISRSLWSI